MNQQILDYARKLSEEDPKTLVEKYTKTVSEIGELADWILPYVNAFATTYRFSNPEKILENVSDAILCLLSIAYDLKVTDQELEEMLNKKLMKWATRQAEAKRVADKDIPFEIHVTVDANVDFERFKQACEYIGVKPTKLELQDENGDKIFYDVMTSSVHYGDNRSVVIEVGRIEFLLGRYGIPVVRSKVETFPFHPAAPSRANGQSMPKDCYFETHMEINAEEWNKVWNNPSPTTRYMLRKLLANTGIRFSQNMKKKDKVVSITLRDYKLNREDYMDKVKAFVAELGQLGIGLSDLLTEFSIYDTKVLHDEAWMNPPKPVEIIGASTFGPPVSRS